MATAAVHGACISDGKQSFYDKLNSKWHERALQLFMVIVLRSLGGAHCSGLPNLCHGLAAAESFRFAGIVLSMDDQDGNRFIMATR